MDGFDNLNDINNTLGLSDSIDNAYDAGQIDGFQSLNCIASQYQSLVMSLIVLYAWSNQATNNYLVNANSQLTCTLSCLLDKLVDSAIDNCKDCAKCAATSPATANDRPPRHKHKKRHRHRNYDCGCNSDCDCDPDDDCDCEEY